MSADEIRHLQALRNEVVRLLATALAQGGEAAAEGSPGEPPGRPDARDDGRAEQGEREHRAPTARATEMHTAEVDQLKTALVTRNMIGQAQGIIMATLGCSSTRAFALLVAESQHQNRKLVDIATEITGRAGVTGNPRPGSRGQAGRTSGPRRSES